MREQIILRIMSAVLGIGAGLLIGFVIWAMIR